MAINWIETEVIEHIKWTDSLASLKFKGAVLPYTSGQYTKVGLEIDGELVSRPYSYVSSPNDDFLEIVYVNVPDGVLTPKLHNLKVGDKLMAMEKSSGFFTMSEVPDGKNLWMLATGTGLGVFISLLRTSDPWQRFENIVLVHGVRNSNELIYQDQINEFHETIILKFDDSGNEDVTGTGVIDKLVIEDNDDPPKAKFTTATSGGVTASHDATWLPRARRPALLLAVL